MLTIAVCDDEAEQVDYLSALVRDWAECCGKRVSIRLFTRRRNSCSNMRRKRITIFFCWTLR